LTISAGIQFQSWLETALFEIVCNLHTLSALKHGLGNDKCNSLTYSSLPVVHDVKLDWRHVALLYRQNLPGQQKISLDGTHAHPYLGLHVPNQVHQSVHMILLISSLT
jgi:hypothetical protein